MKMRALRINVFALLLCLLTVYTLDLEKEVPMKEPDLRDLIAAHPDRGDLPVECVMAVVMKESSLREHAIRYEDHYRWLVGNRDTMPIAEVLGQKHSWGLMQVMGALAREMGFTGPFHELWTPEIGLKYGMLYLRKQYAKHKNWPDALAAYNAGSVRRLDGKYVNQYYVDTVLRYWNDLELHIPLKSTEI